MCKWSVGLHIDGSLLRGELFGGCHLVKDNGQQAYTGDRLTLN